MDVITIGQSTTIFLGIRPFSAWWHPTNRTTEQLGDPRARGLLTSEKVVFCNMGHFSWPLGNHTVMYTVVCLFTFDWKGRPKFRPWVNLWHPCDTLYIVQTCLSPLWDPHIVRAGRLCSPRTWIINLLRSISFKLINNYQSTPPDSTRVVLTASVEIADLKANFTFLTLIILTEKYKLRCV